MVDRRRRWGGVISVADGRNRPSAR